MAMARNWLASAELPGKFWFLAVKRAAEICNYFPLQLEDKTWTTPLTLAHGIKPDLRVLFKVFGLAAVRHERIGDSRLGKFETQSVPMIGVRKCPNSTGLQFYNPANGTFCSSIDYKFQHHVTSGAYFGMCYQPGVVIYRLDETTSIFAPKFQLDSPVYVNTHSPPSIATVIGIPTYHSPDIYTVVFKDGSLSDYTEDLISLAPESVSFCSPSTLPSWMKGGAKATLFLDTMSKPRHGTLNQSPDHSWLFYPGKLTDGILLEDFVANCQHLLDSGQIFRGHAKFKHIYATRNNHTL